MRQPQLELYPAPDPHLLHQKVTPEDVVSLVDEVTKGFRGDVGVVPRQFLRLLVNRFDAVVENPEASLAAPPATVEEQRATEGKKPYSYEPEADDERGYEATTVEF